MCPATMGRRPAGGPPLPVITDESWARVRAALDAATSVTDQCRVAFACPEARLPAYAANATLDTSYTMARSWPRDPDASLTCAFRSTRRRST